ncbi:MFS transporter [Paraburkholderia sp. RL17-373-BIF-A]|uniref:MFS transporter n=1 Tax=Paraburkholderia sp. RL17-373-BIF-A TaxID=3031629 RepID=UPI0038B6C573
MATDLSIEESHGSSTHRIGFAMTALMALACGLIAASSYLAQPLIVFIGPKVGLPLWGASLVMTLSQAGYCVGLVLLAPLGDLLENRRLVLLTLTGLCVALTVMAGATNVVLLLVAAFSLGVGTTAVQMLIPLAAHMTDDASRGRVVGKITGGLLAGIMLARPVASVAENVVGWRGLYILDAVILVALTFLLSRQLPVRQPDAKHDYKALIGSLRSLTRTHRALRQLSAAQACLFAAFSLFWGTAPIILMHRFGFNSTAVALFALVGAAGALSAPVAGYAADHGFGRIGRMGAISVVVCGFAVAGTLDSVAGWVIGALMIDAGVQASHVISQRTILALDQSASSRLNSLYIAIFFLGGALGSALVSPLLLTNWRCTAVAGALIASLAAVFFPGKMQ